MSTPTAPSRQTLVPLGSALALALVVSGCAHLGKEPASASPASPPSSPSNERGDTRGRGSRARDEDAATTRRAEAPAKARPTSTQGVVVLKDGERVEGELIERESGKVVTIETATGQRRTFAWSLVREVLGSVQPAEVKPAPVDEPEERPKPARESKPSSASTTATPSAADSDQVSIRFEPVDGPNTKIEIKVGNQSCTTPCMLSLKRGSHEVEMGSFSEKIELTSSGTVRVRRMSTGTKVVGGMALAVSLIGSSVGFYALASDSEPSKGALIASAGGLVVALPLFLLDPDKLTYTPDTARVFQPSRLAVGVALTPGRGLLSAGLRF